MKDTIISITVEGPVKSGKSTIARLIKEVLDKNGIRNTVLNEDSAPSDLQVHSEKVYAARNGVVTKIYQKSI